MKYKLQHLEGVTPNGTVGADKQLTIAAIRITVADEGQTSLPVQQTGHSHVSEASQAARGDITTEKMGHEDGEACKMSKDPAIISVPREDLHLRKGSATPGDAPLGELSQNLTRCDVTPAIGRQVRHYKIICYTA